MNAREAILAALAGDGSDHGVIAMRAAELVATVERPALAMSLADAFVTALDKASVGASFQTVADAVDVEDAVARYLTEYRLPPIVHNASPGLVWSRIAATLDLPTDGGVVVAQAAAAVAETGTLVIDTGPDRPMLPHFLALHHIVIVDASDLVARLEDIPKPAAIPRSRFWITGVSGTTDIEGQYVRGAHGPRFLHVILIN